MKLSIVCITLIVLCNSCKNQKENIFSEVSNKIDITCQKSKNHITLILVETIKGYVNENREKVEFNPYKGVINNSSEFIIFDRFENKFFIFDLNDYGNSSEPKKIVCKNKGNGPNEITSVYDIVYSESEDMYYLSDMLQFHVYRYDKELNEVGRFKTNDRPYKLFVTYESGVAFSPYYRFVTGLKYNIEYAFNNKIPEIWFQSKNIYKDHYKNMLFNQYMVAFIDSNKYLLTNQFSNYNILLVDKNKVEKVITSYNQSNKLRNNDKSITRTIDGEKKKLHFLTYQTLDYSQKMNLVFATMNSGLQTSDYKVSSIIWIFNLKGETLCEFKIEEVNEHTSLVIDSLNEMLYLFNGTCIKKYKLQGENNEI